MEWFFLGRPDFANLEQRMVHVICLGGSTAALLALPINYFIVTGWVITLSNVVESILLITVYIYSRITGKYKKLRWPVILSLQLFFAVQWFYNAGSSGSVDFYFVVIGLVATAIFHAKERYIAMGTIGGSFLVVNVLEAYYPQWVVPYNTPSDRLLDMILSFFIAITLAMITVAVLANHNRELIRRNEEKNRLIQEDLRIARKLQSEFLRATEIKIQGYDYALLYEPAHGVGGDFFDVTSIAGGTRIMMADLKGHGVSAALTAMLLKSEWTHSNHQTKEPGQALAQLNDELTLRYDYSLFLCVFLVDLYPDHISYASGGIPPQYLTDGSKVQELSATGIPLGIRVKSHYDTRTLSFHSGNRLFLYTDALIEEYSQRGVAVGMDWLQETLTRTYSSSGEILQSVLDRFLAMTGKVPGDTVDDLTIIVIGSSTQSS